MEILRLGFLRLNDMNTKSVIICTICATALSCFGQSNVVYYGANSNALNVVFVDTNLLKKAQSAIVADLRVCLLEWGKTAELLLDGGDEPGVIGYLDIGTVSPHYPENIKFPSHIVSNGTAGVALQIPKELSDAYTNAFKFAAANAKAFSAASAFVKFVNSPNFLTLPPKDLPNYVLEKNTTVAEIIAGAQDTISELRHQTYYPPSVLGFFNSEIGPAKKNLLVIIPCTSPVSDWKEWGGYPAIWHEGKWKFFFWTIK